MKAWELGLWTPLIGFDVTQKDKGVKDYLDGIGMPVDSIGLFVYNADIINYHVKGMPEEKQFPPDYCNYYGSPQNDLRARQDWTNYDLRALCGELKKHGVESYLSVMGNHLSPERDDDFTPQIGMFGYPVKQDFVMEHRELAIESTKERGYIHLLKNFKDGTSFGDYFINKAVECICDYGADGLHLADAIFPHSIQIQHGDFSDDLFGRFISSAGITPPQNIAVSLKDEKSAGVAARADFVWNNYREVYLDFIANEWEKFFTKLCVALHAHGKKVIVNNAWTMAPFEAYYRFAVDYKALERAGVDKICVEDQATILYLSEPGSRYKINELMAAPYFIRAYAPNIKNLAINYSKDGTEEGSVINHCPMADEREIYTLTSPLYVSDKGTERAVEGFFVCLADSVSREEWTWLKKRYEIAFRHSAVKTLSATLVFSDNTVKPFVGEYAATRRYSAHKTVSVLSSFGGKMGAVVRTENLKYASGLIFVPNIDVLSNDELEKVKSYKGGVVYTSVVSKKPKFYDEIYFEDTAEPNADYRFCVGGFNLGDFEKEEVESILSSAAPKPANEFLGDAEYWLEDNGWREVSVNVMKALARLLFLASQSVIRAETGNLITLFELDNGMLRLVSENDMLNHYKTIKVNVKGKKIKKIINGNDFPVQPLKLIMSDGKVRSNIGGDEQLKDAIGFVIKLPPGGCSFVDLELE